MRLLYEGGAAWCDARVESLRRVYSTRVLTINREGYSNRIFFLTDMEVTREDGDQFKKDVLINSNNNLWSTVVGVGLDLTGVRNIRATCPVRST